MQRRDTLLIVLHRPGIEAVHAQAAQVAADVAQLCAEVAALWADVAQLREHNSSLGFEASDQSVPKQARQEAVHVQAAQLAADVAQLRAEVAALRKRSISLERSLARPSNEVSSWSLQQCAFLLGHQMG